MSEENLHPTRPRSRVGLVIVLLALAVVFLLGWRGWASWHAWRASERAASAQASQRIAALEQRLETLRRDQRAQGQRLLDAAATNRVLRDEVLGLSQRGALLEQSISRLADPTRHGAQALRLDEVELLLSQARQRLEIADDLDGARRAYALAAGALQGVDDPRLLNLRQALAQERGALDALGKGPRAALSGQLDAFYAALPKLPRSAAVDARDPRPAWQRWLSPLVDMRPTRDEMKISSSDRSAAQAALQVEQALAHAALERNDQAGFRAAIARIDAWLPRLWPDSPALRQARAQLRGLRAAPLQSDSPVLGSTLDQLRLLRNSGFSLPAPAIAAGPPAPQPPELE